MSPAFAAMRDIVAGRAPADHALLQNCRLEGFGTRAFGREPILDLFRRHPLALTEPLTADSPRALLATDGDRAVFADVHDGRVTRLWVLGAEPVPSEEPSVSVPRDLDLSQFEADIFFDPADHPDLDRPAASILSGVLRGVAQPEPGEGDGLPGFSRRVFVARAFSSGDQVAALIVIAGALDGAERKPFSVNAALLANLDHARSHATGLIIDQAGLDRCRERPWTPRL